MSLSVAYPWMNLAILLKSIGDGTHIVVIQ